MHVGIQACIILTCMQMNSISLPITRLQFAINAASSRQLESVNYFRN